MNYEKKVTRVHEVMKPGIDIVDGMMTVAAVLDNLKYPENRTIVINKRHDDDEYGVVMFSDIARKVLAAGRAADRVNIYEIMSKPVISIHPTMDVRYCVSLFDRFGLSRAPVIEGGQIQGLVSYTDIVLKGMSRNSDTNND
jgi:signal-transduction protein with cAMP-binding, CBS, and nucleotidyltransferase domain